jgi:2-haloacid dehalogenase
MTATSVIVFDVNETLSDLQPLTQRFADIGLPPQLAQTWFAQVLRDGFALAAAGGSATFSTIADNVLRNLFPQHAPDREPDAAVQHVLDGFSSLQVHPDVPAGVRALADGGLRLVTLSNGSTRVAETLLTSAGVRQQFESLLSVDAAGRWKPAPESYAYAARECGVPPAELMLVAVHPWDLDGAARAGLQTAWIDRSGAGLYPSYLSKPDLTVSGVEDLARRVVGHGPSITAAVPFP